MSTWFPLLRLKERTSPYWFAYQLYRLRGKVLEDPDYIPEWFLRDEIMVKRLREARVALEQLGAPKEKPSNWEIEALTTAHAALRTLESFVRGAAGPDPLGARERVLAALLGGQELENEQDHRDDCARRGVPYELPEPDEAYVVVTYYPGDEKHKQVMHAYAEGGVDQNGRPYTDRNTAVLEARRFEREDHGLDPDAPPVVVRAAKIIGSRVRNFRTTSEED